MKVAVPIFCATMLLDTSRIQPATAHLADPQYMGLLAVGDKVTLGRVVWAPHFSSVNKWDQNAQLSQSTTEPFTPDVIGDVRVPPSNPSLGRT